MNYPELNLLSTLAGRERKGAAIPDSAECVREREPEFLCKCCTVAFVRAWVIYRLDSVSMLSAAAAAPLLTVASVSALRRLVPPGFTCHCTHSLQSVKGISPFGHAHKFHF